MYSEKSFNIYFHKYVFSQIFVANRDSGQFCFRNNSFWTVQFSLKNLKVSWGAYGFNILIQKYASEKLEQIYEFSLKVARVVNLKLFFTD